MSVSLLSLVGRVGNDPESRYTNGGNLVVTFSVATSTSFKNKTTGQKVTQTEWHHLVLYRQQAEFAQQYITKGRLVFAEGRVQSRKYTDKQGIERTVYEVLCDRIQNLPDGRYSENAADTSDDAAAAESATTEAGAPAADNAPPKKQNKSGKADKSGKSEAAPASPPPPLDDPDDDIPF